MTNKFFKNQLNLVALLLLLLSAGLYSCSEKITSEDTPIAAQANVSPAGSMLKVASLTTTSPQTTYTLWAGQTINAGTLVVSNDGTNLYVTYNTTGVFGTLHLWVGTNLGNMPATTNGTPIPGQFPYSVDASAVTTYQFVIPLSSIVGADICGGNVYIVAHAEVTINGNHETAFGGDIAGDANRWYFYANYLLKDVVPPTASDAVTSVSCITDVPDEDPGIITDEADNCALASNAVTFVDETETAVSVCPKVITRNYLVTDAAGNTTAVKHTITVTDETAPEWVTVSLPSKEVACDAALVWDVPVASDCNGSVLSSSDATALPVIADGFGYTSTTRTWYATDPCLNRSVAMTQTITVKCPVPTSQPCFETSSETAWAAGSRYVTKGNWATWVAYSNVEKVVKLYAGQTKEIGTATFRAKDGNNVTIDINITTAGWELVPGVDNIKIQGYSSTPPKSNPSPGSFANKMSGSGTTASIVVPAANYYGVHLDVQLKVEVPCPVQ